MDSNKNKLNYVYFYKNEMEIMIPVTMVLKSEKIEHETQEKMSEELQNEKFFGLKSEVKLTENEASNYLPEDNYFESKKNTEKDEGEINDEIEAKSIKNKQVRFNFSIEEEENFKKHHERMECDLEKKSTRSSLHDIPGHEYFEHENFAEESQGNIITKKQIVSLEKNKQIVEHYFHTENDEQSQSINSFCKICLEEGITNLSSFYEKNNLFRVCKCHDYVHINCLEEWINHRDILNENIQANQCEVCKESYSLELITKNFFSFEILKKNLKYRPFIVTKKFVFSFFFFLLSLFGLYLLISLLVESGSNGGHIQEVLGMPYATCVTVTIFLLFIVLLIFGIFTYTFILDMCLDFKYKIQKVIHEQESCRNLKTLFTDWR